MGCVGQRTRQFDKNSAEFLEIDPAFIAGERPVGREASRRSVNLFLSSITMNIFAVELAGIFLRLLSPLVINKFSIDFS
jgi:hypothetical protein